MANILDGKSVADRLNKQTTKEISDNKLNPRLAVILVGDDPASQIYVSHKQKQCELVGIDSLCAKLPNSITESELKTLIKDYNSDPTIHGILVQLPLPKHISRSSIVNAIDPNKDVDGFHALNMGMIVHQTPNFLPCTPSAIKHILQEYKIELNNVVIVNRSIVVGQPLALMLMQEDVNATVTVCHDGTKCVAEHTRNADVVIVAVGNRDNFVLTGDMIKEGAVVIDVGISRRNGRIVGDVDESVYEKASWITRPIGGVGPVTVAFLLQNTVKAAKGIK